MLIYLYVNWTKYN